MPQYLYGEVEMSQQELRFRFGKASGIYGSLQGALSLAGLPSLPFGLTAYWEHLIYAHLPEALAKLTVFAANAILGACSSTSS